VVGARGFEPPTSCSQSRRASQTTLRPEYRIHKCSTETHLSLTTIVYANNCPVSNSVPAPECRRSGIPLASCFLGMCSNWHPNCGCQVRWKLCPSMKDHIEPTYRDPREHGAAEELSLIDLRPSGGRLAHPVSQSRGSEGFSVPEWPIQWAI
jgi:hypothetical protein